MVIAKSKKVKPPMYTIKKNMDYNWTNVPEQSKKQDAGVPRAILTPHANSLPFEERHVTVDETVRIGRNVYRAAASPTNAIFECRVLSRQHATLYYEKGHFYLVDNKSSNGTFINNNRCNEHEPNEVFSGDVVQFGIPVVENVSNSEKNTFPPVIAHLKLFHPDDEEAKLSYNPTMITPLHLKELYQLNNFVQEAIQREASLENRLRTLRECVERTRAEAQASWELFVGEQRLLMRVHTLESMLSVGKQPDEQHLTQLLNDKRNYQKVAQESLRAAHEQRLALEESLERRSREAAALHHHNCALRLAANNALAELQKLAARCERKMCAARLAITAAEEREKAVRSQLPLAYSVQNGETKMLVLSTDSNKLQEPKRSATLEEAVRALPDYVKMLLPQQLLNKVGIKIVSADGKSAKEFELILKKNNAYNSENKDTEKLEAEEDGVGGSCEEKSNEPDSCTDDEKQSRLNHEPGHEERSSPLDGELCPDNNANSTYTETSNREDSPAQLTRSTVAEEANLAEIQRLASNAAEMQAELAFRPTRSDVDDLTSVIEKLRADLMVKDQQIERLLAGADRDRAAADKAVETTRSLEDLGGIDDDCADRSVDAGKISAEIDEMFRLDFDDDEDDETDSVATVETNREEVGERTRLSDEQRLQVTLQNGSLHALEEELVRAKERWAEESCERARLAAQLAALRTKSPLQTPVLALVAPLLAAALYWLLLPYIS
ncbi:sarcolemmal membrane-associated protein isoform X3 [Bombyx mori]|uniref:FHA domain-containing protein n=1 Tax=Bombyx mori TaxID=7091 RepID=A0A8R2DPR5_BOMMO|nr:sarcolemmal membrane-associated protein isoform X3 [Bombyx mori]